MLLKCGFFFNSLSVNIMAGIIIITLSFLLSLWKNDLHTVIRYTVLLRIDFRTYK